MAHAQPNERPATVVTPPQPPRRVRPAEPGAQITQDLTEFIAVLNGNAIFPNGLRFIAGARIGYFGANDWAREVQRLRDVFRFEIDNISVDKIEGEMATATLIYHFKTIDNIPDNPEAKRRIALLAEEKTETLTLKLGTFSPNPEKIWQIVPPEEQPAEPQLDGKVGFLAYAAYFLAQKQGLDAQLRARPSLQNLRQLGLGVLQFVADWDERFAFAPEYAREALMPYVDALCEVHRDFPDSRQPRALRF